MAKKVLCACAGAASGQHLKNCAFKASGVRADFSDFVRIFNKLADERRQDLKPRDPKRIPKILKRLWLVWEKNPDLRLSQLIQNVFPNGAYHIEDEVLISALEKFYRKNCK